MLEIYPTPFNLETTFDLPYGRDPRGIMVCNMLDGQAATLAYDVLPYGNHSVHFDGRTLASDACTI